jgi:hypothetical protein
VTRHFTAAEKSTAVTRILRGEEPNRVAAEMSVSQQRLQKWERIFLEGGRRSLSEHHDGLRWIRSGKVRKLLPWAGLVILLIAIVYAASRFLQRGSEP